MISQILLNLCFLLFISNYASKVSSQTYPNRVIHASLTDKDTGRVWQIQEWVHSSSKKTGRIEIKSDDEQVNVFYLYKGGRDNGKRLVIHDDTCEVYNYDLIWDKRLPGVNKPLTNLILLTGPSILDRLSGLSWKNGNDEVIRGSLMHSVTAVLEDKLNITFYYENNLNQATGIQQPSQIVFSGYNPDTLVEGEPENLILDIYLHSQTSQELDKLVQVTPGFGCPIYLNGDHAFPELNSRKVHYIVAEQIKASASKTINEIHADEVNQIVRLSELKYGYTREKIFDYSLGINYELSKSGDCGIFPIKPDAPGIDESGSLSVDKLLWLSKSLRYLGEIMFERRSNYYVHVWESTETNKDINGKTYDKVVTTQYLSSSFMKDTFMGYSPVAATMKAYNKDDKGKYLYAYSIHRDYYDSNSDLPESAYHQAFQITDCFKKPEQKMNLKFHLTCKDDGCVKKSQDAVYEMRELFKSSLLEHLRISSNRLTDINFEFGQGEIEADVTFLEAPLISNVLYYNPYISTPKTEQKIHDTVATDVESCLRYHSRFIPSGSFISFCYSDKSCFTTNNVKDIATPSREGVECNVYEDPYKKLNRLGQEKLLSELHDHILGYFGKISFNLNLDETAKAVAFQVTDVVAKIDSSDEEVKRPFHTLFTGNNFKQIDGINTVMVPGIDNFGDCYRTCATNADIYCETFSFCQRKDTKECYVSTMKESEVEYNRTKDSDCRIAVKDYLSNYMIRPKLKYKNPTSVSVLRDKRNCAAECYASKDCVSFEFCENGGCTFGGLVTPTNAEYAARCDLYIPKRSQKYAITGKKLVSQVLYTQVDLDLDQCAAVCDDDLSCKSFNFCPKSKASSQCQITSYSIKDSKTESIESNICHNFELSVSTNGDTVSYNSLDVKNTGVSGGGVFGIIMSCLFIGLFAGFVGSYVFIKVKSKDTNRSTENFGWSKQKNEDEDEDLTTI